MQEKKKILFVVEAMGGGIFTYIVDLTNELVNTYDMYIAYATRRQTPSDYKKYFDERIHLIEVKNFTRSVRSSKDIKAFFEIRKIAKEINPDIIHLHSSKAGAIGRWAFNGRKTTLYYTPHGYSFLMKNYGFAKRTIYRAIEFICAKRKCTTISCGEGEYQETLKMTKHALRIDNGVNTGDMDQIIASFRPEREHQFTVFTLGRICHQKNPELFNEIANAMPDVRFLWVGDGELRTVLTAPNIEITGWMEHKEAILEGYSSDAFILTSLWEGLPISLLEAMYMKKPCVVSDVIGNNDVIENGVNGFVCNTLSDYTEGIQRIKSGEANQMAEEAHREILDKYNVNIMAEKYIAVYDKSMKKMDS